MGRSESGLFQVLESLLKRGKEPVTCSELFDHPEVREYAATANRVSDYLGNMWRKGLVERLPAPRGNNSSARWMYQWRGKIVKKEVHAEPRVFVPPAMLQRPDVQIREDGDLIIIELPNFIIRIEAKK